MHGTVRGQAMAVADAVSGPIQSSGMGYAEVLLSTSPNLCADAATNTLRANQTTVDILLANNTGTALLVPSMTGTYGVGAMPLRAVVFVQTLDSQCQVASSSMASATNGTVELTAVSGDVFAGTFDVMLDSQDHITGSFEPEACPSLAALGSGAMCM